jgi:hypothetical protein
MLRYRPRPDSLSSGGGLFTDELDSIACDEDLDLVTLVGRGVGDQQP